MFGLSKCLWRISQNDSALALADRTEALAEKLHYDYGVLIAVEIEGLIYTNRCIYPSALKKYLECLTIAEKLHNRLQVAAAYGNISNIYFYEGNFPEALKYATLALNMGKETGNKKEIGADYGSLGAIYAGMGNNAEALKNYMQALSYAKETDDTGNVGFYYGNIGSIYLADGNLDKAMEYLKLSLSIAKEVGDRISMGGDYENIAHVLIMRKDHNAAKAYLDSAVYIARTISDNETLRDTYKTMANIDSATGDYKGAYNMYKRYIACSDSIINDKNTKKLVQEQMQYDFDKKQAEEKAEQGKKDVLAEADKKKQQIVTGAVSVGLLLVLAFSGMLFSRFKVTQRQKKIIEEQKGVVEEKNKDILDSIIYAKRLQDAILPPLSEIKSVLPQSFVLYKPKDIVAGDFYWLNVIASETKQSKSAEQIASGAVHPRNDVILIAACDCTGHGVPGAMVSVVCSNALNRAVKEFGLTEPGKILDKTRELVVETFEKSEGDIKDGMDISLCAITPLTLEEGPGVRLQWAGAYNPLWYIPHAGEGRGEVIELSPDKQPIGKSDNAKPFTTHTFTLSPPLEAGEAGVSLYLFTDGYADQFGGPKGKKYKYKQLQQLIKDNAGLAMEKQKELLEKEFESWKGNNEQTDDVCVIGIRV